METKEKCFNCEHLKFRDGYEYPFRCEKHKHYSCKESEIMDYFDKPCKFYRRKDGAE